MNPDSLQTSVQFLRGVGPERANLLANLGITTVEDLLWNLPRDVLDLTNVCRAAELRAGELQTVRGTVVDRDGRTTGTGRTMVGVLIESDGLYVRGLWFNQPWMIRKFEVGEAVLFSGKPKRNAGRWEFSHPRVQSLGDADAEATGEVLPLYRLTEGLSQDQLRRIVRAAVEQFVELVADPLPEELRARLGVCGLRQAIRELHLPKTVAEYESGRRRLIFDDLFEFQLGLALRRRSWKTRTAAPELPTTAKIDARIRRLFPFTFTEGQSRAVAEISRDLGSGEAMHRLLQAEVGAGKTAVALYSILVTVAAGHQAVFMAPTEVLANQHWATIDRALAQSRVNRLLLTGGLNPRDRRDALAGIADGSVSLVVGTQAVIQKDVTFAKLGLVVIDEQHKFGVMQRAMFSKGNGALAPHVLVMTATPIPRSLCLTQFGDLDLTTIVDTPPGRQKVITSRVSDAPTRLRAWEFIKEQLAKGRQAYVVCPRIEATAGDLSKGPAASAEEVFKLLSAGTLQNFRVGLIHGRLDSDLKAAGMEAFRNGKIDVLVSTTVVEVGIDVPNATIMVIDEAHRFGLSQLHQLRGRISRGKFQGYCFLFSDADSPEALRRLEALEKTADGFAIAEADFEIRGPGDVLGTRQHGELPLRVADLARDADILKEARTAAFELVRSGEFDQPELVPLKVRVLERFGKALDLPQTG
ncbi:MAG TPA: ATP-dependent DNA helicase RecG [Planctomycetaceae bacterium]|jgi:ATP-dependent DNA helicase RecG|nr:ATP-dependent DNA helicase RecG [Planctomycetaceae bacterium]